MRKKIKIALVHDHLAQDGGAERVLKAFLDVWPDAPVFVLVHDKEVANACFAGKDVRTSFIQQMPGGVRHYQWYLPLMPTATESFDLRGFDVVLSSSASFAKGVITDPECLHINYCHTPTRYLWTDTHTYVREIGHVNFLVKKLIPYFLTFVRQWDRLAADRVDIFIANSKLVQERIKKYYKRDSLLLYPSVQSSRFQVQPEVGDYFLAGGRLVPYKRLDMVVEAFNQIGRPLKIFGDGPELERLKEMADENIEFLGRVPDSQMGELYGKALAFINPQVEDFGITAIESMACGRPVIAYGEGGALETVIPGKTGILFEDQVWEHLAEAVIRFNPEAFDPHTIRTHAIAFDEQVFMSKIRSTVEELYERHKSK